MNRGHKVTTVRKLIAEMRLPGQGRVTVLLLTLPLFAQFSCAKLNERSDQRMKERNKLVSTCVLTKKLISTKLQKGQVTQAQAVTEWASH